MNVFLPFHLHLLLFLLQKEASREGHQCARTADCGSAVPPPQLPVVLSVGLEGKGGRLGLLLPGPLSPLVPDGYFVLDGSGGISPLPSAGPRI